MRFAPHIVPGRFRRRWLALLALLLVGAFAGFAQASNTPPRPLLWEVSDGERSVYLLGTFHLLSEDDYPLDPAVYAALDDAETVFFELAPKDLADPTLGVRFARAGVRADGRTLQSQLDGPSWQALQGLARETGTPIEVLQRMEPWFAALSLSMAGMRDVGLNAQLGLDRHLAQRAVREGKKTVGLETPQQQIDLFDGLPLRVQLSQLRDVVERSAEIRAETEWLHAQWREGDVDALYWGMAAAMRARDPALYSRLNTRRNEAWLKPIVEVLSAPGSDDALVAVGTLHLLGSEGLVQRLAAMGYRVERL